MEERPRSRMQKSDRITTGQWPVVLMALCTLLYRRRCDIKAGFYAFPAMYACHATATAPVTNAARCSTWLGAYKLAFRMKLRFDFTLALGQCHNSCHCRSEPRQTQRALRRPAVANVCSQASGNGQVHEAQLMNQGQRVSHDLTLKRHVNGPANLA